MDKQMTEKLLASGSSKEAYDMLANWEYKRQ